MSANDPFETLHLPDDPVRPRSDFLTALRGRLVEALDLDAIRPTVSLPPRRTTMPTPAVLDTTIRITPYMAVHDGPAALDFYRDAFGAVEVLRFAGDDGRLGHAEFTIGDARFYLSDEFPELGVSSPRTLGGTSVTLHLELPEVDSVFQQAMAAGATPLMEPADQPHGSRHGTLTDPFGHRWMLSQPLETLDTGELEERMSGSGWSVEAAPARSRADGGIWGSINAADAPAMIALLTDVFGFEAELVVPGEEASVIVHSQLRWTQGGGVIQVGTANRPGNVFSQRPTGGDNVYVITTDPDRIYQRCLEAGLRVVADPVSPDYDPDGSVFTVADPEGNLWTFGSYGG